MNILIVTNYFLPHANGVGFSVDKQARLLTERGHNVTIITSHTESEAPYEETSPDGKMRILRIPAWNVFERRLGIGWPIFSPVLLKYLWQGTRWSNVVHVHGYLFANMTLALLIARLRGKRAILTEYSGTGLPARRRWRWLFAVRMNTFGRINIALAHSVVCANTHMLRKIRSMRPEVDAHLLPHVHERKWMPADDTPPTAAQKRAARQKLDLPNDRKLVLFVGRVTALKGVDLLLAAYDGSYELIFCGPASNKMIEAITSRGARHVNSQPPQMLLNYFRAADLTVLPSRSEGMPRVVSEALRCGCEMLLGQYPGSEFFASCRGIYYTELNPQALRTNIRYRLDHPRQDVHTPGKVGIRSLVPSPQAWTDALVKLFEGTLPPAPRLLFVAAQDSPHTARWIHHLSGLGWNIRLFAVNERPAHPLLRDIVIHHPLHSLRWLLGWITLRNRRGVRTPALCMLLDAVGRMWRYRGPSAHLRYASMYGPQQLVKVISSFWPDLIHSLEFQHCGYLTLEAKRLYEEDNLDDFPPWAISSWGSDIYHYRHVQSHVPLITDMLKQADFYIADCHRDLELAQGMGWDKKPSLVIPAFGGLPIAHWQNMRQQIAPSQRTQLMIKGYQNHVGQALTALQAADRCGDLLKDREVVLFLATHPDVIFHARKLALDHGALVRILPYLSCDEIMQEFLQTRVTLSVSLSDGTPATLLESMVAGAFPIQSDTSAVNEWINDGQGGFIVPADNVELIAARLRTALMENPLVDNAAEHNWQTATQMIDSTVTTPEIMAFYRGMLGERSADL